MIEKNIGFAFCASCCTYEKAVGALKAVCGRYDNVMPILSENAYTTDSRFTSAKDLIERIETVSGKKAMHTIAQVEPVGPKALLDLLIIAPCTGNTLAKLANGVTDTSVTMAAKAHLRNGRPVLIAVSTNDGLSGNAANIGALLNRRNIFFVPFCQDDPQKKPCSLVADFELVTEAARLALEGRQMQPLLLSAPSNGA